MAAADAGVVVENVDAAEELPRVRDHAVQLIEFGDVDAKRQRLPARDLDRARGFLRQFDALIGDHHARAFTGEAECDRAADTARAAGDDRDAIL